jgi:putative FmdB family regulatory protein
MQFERMQRMSDDPLTECPECDGHVRRIIQPVGIIFKGSGFYVTDNRSGSSATLSSPKEKAEPSTEGSKEDSAVSTETSQDD